MVLALRCDIQRVRFCSVIHNARRATAHCSNRRSVVWSNAFTFSLSTSIVPKMCLPASSKIGTIISDSCITQRRQIVDIIRNLADIDRPFHPDCSRSETFRDRKRRVCRHQLRSTLCSRLFPSPDLHRRFRPTDMVRRHKLHPLRISLSLPEC